MAVVARLFRVTGLVQGVGFRPTVYRVARELGLAGEVFNDAAGVGIVLEGEEKAVGAFEASLRKNAPPLSRIDSITEASETVKGLKDFVITPSRGGVVKTAITPDAATCEACLVDMFNPKNRRYRYAFTNCTHCGPRYTITRALPYDRPQTSMAKFPMCEDCRHEYEDPEDRRFHAQPNACPVCGPELSLYTSEKTRVEGDVIGNVVSALKAGKIVAIKGLGGFHLACDATNKDAVNELRRRKRRDEKPFAVMFANAVSARKYVQIDGNEATLLEGAEHPIVLLEKKAGEELEGVADKLSEVGVMLPYTPLHWLIFHEFAGRPIGTDWIHSAALDTVLVMTSANPSGEPLVTGNEEAFKRLGAIADLFLLHNRSIVVGCDDSVIRPLKTGFSFIRRARGYTPRAVRLKEKIPATLATGPYLKNTAAVSRDNEAFLTQHIGDLANRASEKALEDAIRHITSILEVTPEIVASDAHPDFFSTHLAKAIATEKNLPYYPIYHHAAHIGVAMAELGRTEPTLGLALDGTGLGPAGGIWGGELLLVGARGFARLGHLKELALLGGDKAAREPWRMGAALLFSIGKEDAIVKRYKEFPGAAWFSEAAANTRLTKRTSALGRYFDGVASLLGLCDIQHDEATAAMRLEALARGKVGKVLPDWSIEGSVIDITPAIGRLIENPDKAQAAADFHRTLARALAESVAYAAKEIGYMGPVAVTGGCAANKRLTAALAEDLKSLGFNIAIPSLVPAGDGGLALGELWLAALCHKAGAEEHRFLANQS